MQISANEIDKVILLATLIFLLAPAFLLIYIYQYNKRKKKHREEKDMLRLAFETEIIKTQLEVQEQTMQTIGTELHDNIGQLLSLTSLTLNSIELSNKAKAQQKIDDSIDLTLRSIKELRQLGHILQGDRLVAVGVVAAMRQLISWMERAGKYEIVYTAGDEIPAGGSQDKDLIIFRIAQEVFNNIIKHAAATRVTVALDYEAGNLTMEIADNGIGFRGDEGAHWREGMGLQNIRKRAVIIGGGAVIESTPGAGSKISILIPYP